MTTDDGGTTTDDGGTSYDLPQSYPYGADETQVQQARQVMEEAGYGPDNRYELSWLQYSSDSYEQMAGQIQSRLRQAHVDMSISTADFGSLISQARDGEVGAFTLGWIADYPAADNFLQLADPPRTNYNNSDATGAYVYWSENAVNKSDQVYATENARQAAIDAFDQVENNQGPTDEQQEARNEAYLQMEKAIWEDVPMIMNTHGVSEPMWYDYVDTTPAGAMGGSRAKENQVSIEGKSGSNPNTYEVINSTISTLDPIRSTDTAGGSVIQNVFDALTNYPNGQTNVENLLAEDFEVNDAFDTYTFTLKEDVQFHNGDSLTAEDFVYSFRRLAESGNSRRASFLTDFLGISHRVEVAEFEERETDEGETVQEPVDGTRETIDSSELSETDKQRVRTIPESLEIEAVDETTLEINLDEPFASSLTLLAYSSFSAVPEGLLGDIEGYQGEVDYQAFSNGDSDALVGCGPFTMGSRTANEEVTVERFDDYHGETANVDAVNWAIITGTTARYNYFINQNADAGGVPDAQYDQNKVTVERTDDRGRDRGTYGPLSNGETVNYAKVPEVSTFYIGFNCEATPKPVRQAMAHVVNMPQFVQTIFKGRSAPAFHLTPPQLFPGGSSSYDDHYQA